jgi:hypothetical protein
MNARTAAAEARRVGHKAEGSHLLDHAVRVGLVAYGVVHLLIAWVAVQLAFGDDTGQASGQGALSQLASTPIGGPLLFVVAVGFFALVVWQLMEAAVGHRMRRDSQRALHRIGSLGKAVLYGALGGSALQVAMGGGSSTAGTDSTTAKVMALPAGPFLVGLVGLGVLTVAGALIYRGLSGGFTEHLRVEGQTGRTGRAFVAFGMVGHVSKGAALLVVGGLFGYAALTHDPEKSGGLDQALHQVLQQPFGAPVLTAMGLGIACFGLYCFAWAAHLDR